MRLWRGEARFIGTAATQGSKRLGRNPATGAPVMIEVDSGLPEFRFQLKDSMLKCRPLPGPLERVAILVRLTVIVLRPQAHYGAKGELYEWAPRYPAAGKDLDKVQRAVGDSGTGIWWFDDRQIAHWDVGRLYGEIPKVLIEAEQLEAGEPERRAEARSRREAARREAAEAKANERKRRAEERERRQRRNPGKQRS